MDNSLLKSLKHQNWYKNYSNTLFIVKICEWLSVDRRIPCQTIKTLMATKWVRNIKARSCISYSCLLGWHGLARIAGIEWRRTGAGQVGGQGQQQLQGSLHTGLWTGKEDTTEGPLHTSLRISTILPVCILQRLKSGSIRLVSSEVGHHCSRRSLFLS